MILDRLHLGIGAAVLLIGGIALHEHDGRIREIAVASAVQQTQAGVQKQLDTKFAGIQKQMDDRDADLRRAQAADTARFQSAQSPTQIAALATQLMGLKQPIQIVTPPATKENPNPEPIAELPLIDAPQAKAYLAACESNALLVPKLQADIVDLKVQVGIKDEKVKSVTEQRDAAITEAKGGHLGHRVVKALEYIGVGVVLACAVGHCKL